MSGQQERRTPERRSMGGSSLQLANRAQHRAAIRHRMTAANGLRRRDALRRARLACRGQRV